MKEKDINFEIRDYVLYELRNAMNDPKGAELYRTMAFGAVFFASNHLFSAYNKELATWWEEDILPMFNTIVKRGY